MPDARTLLIFPPSAKHSFPGVRHYEAQLRNEGGTFSLETRDFTLRPYTRVI